MDDVLRHGTQARDRRTHRGIAGRWTLGLVLACGVMGIGVICGEIGAAAGRQFVGDLSDDLLDPRNEHAAYQFAHWIFDATTPLDW